MVINLNIKDRITLISILPNLGRIVDLVEIMDLVKAIKFTDEEKELALIQELNGRVTWNINNDINKDFELNFNQIKIIKDTIKKLDDSEKVDMSILNTCLKFINL